MKFRTIFMPMRIQYKQDIFIRQHYYYIISFLLSVKYNNNNPTIMDRLFGKQLSNILDPQSHNNKPRYLSRVHSLLNKSNVEQHSKINIKKVNKSTVNQNQINKIQKVQLQFHRIQQQAKDQQKDVQLVEEYFEDCMLFMRSQEEKNHKVKNYMAQQTEISDKMRGILLDWLVDLHFKFKMFPQTLYLTVMIIDKYLCKKSASKQNLQLIGTTALYIAAKYEQTYQVPQIDELVHFAAKAFTKDQLIKMEAEIIDILDFNLIMETSFKFFEPLTKVCKMEQKNFHLAQYVIQLSLFETKFLDYKPSLIASSSIYLINKIRKRPESWPSSLEKLTGYPEKQLKACARQLCQLLQRADELPNNKSLKKKFSLPKYNEVTRIKLQRKK